MSPISHLKLISLLLQLWQLILTSKLPSMNETDIRALTLVGPTGKSLVLDPLTVLRLNNRLYMLQLTQDFWSNLGCLAKV